MSGYAVSNRQIVCFLLFEADLHLSEAQIVCARSIGHGCSGRGYKIGLVCLCVRVSVCPSVSPTYTPKIRMFAGGVHMYTRLK